MSRLKSTGLAGGGKIAIVELNGGWTNADMQQFFDGISQPMPQIQDVSVDGTKNDPNQHLGDPRDPDGEVALDIEVAAAAYYVATGQPADFRRAPRLWCNRASFPPLFST